MRRTKLLISATLAFWGCACLYSPVFNAMPRFMDRFDADPLSKAEMKGKCNVCHIEEDGFGPLNTFGKAFEESGYRITDGLRSQAPELFTGVQAAKSSAPSFDPKGFYDKNCTGCHGAEGKGGDTTMIVPNFKDLTWQKRRTDQNILDTIAKGKGMMPAWKDKLTEEQIKTMAAFIRKFPER